jgi:glutamate racemase
VFSNQRNITVVNLFNKTIEIYQDTKIVEQVGYGLVELIENGEINSPEMTKLLHSYLQPMIDANIDYLVLGCSHYPYLIPQIKKIHSTTHSNNRFWRSSSKTNP